MIRFAVSKLATHEAYVPKVDKTFYTSLRSLSFPTDLPDDGRNEDVRFVCYVRTEEHNKILSYDGKVFLYEGVVTHHEEFQFDEMGDLFVKSLFDKVFVFPTDPQVIADLSGHIHVFPLGAFVLDGKPYVCYNLIVPSDFMNDHINVGYGGFHIQNMTETSPMIEAIRETFVLTKGD